MDGQSVPLTPSGEIKRYMNSLIEIADKEGLLVELLYDYFHQLYMDEEPYRAFLHACREWDV